MYTDICEICSVLMILLLVVVFITKYRKDKYFVPGGHEVGSSAGIDIPTGPGMVFGYHMISFCLPVKEVSECVILIKCLLHMM
jgi:hypothetical protein